MRSIALSAPAIAVASGFGSIWALDSSGTLYRIAQDRIAKRITLPVRAAYNIWTGGNSVWVADDQGAQVVRVVPKTGRILARIPVGDGPADMAFSGGTAWVINHRDRVLSRIELATNKVAPLATVAGDAPERMVWFRDALWITGRGTDLLQVDPTDGSLEATIEIGASGIDVAAAGDSLWVPTRSRAVDVRGFPTMNALIRVSVSSRRVSTVVRPAGRVDVHGLAVGANRVWMADNTDGRLYQVR